jgi:hypothetical protein
VAPITTWSTSVPPNFASDRQEQRARCRSSLTTKSPTAMLKLHLLPFGLISLLLSSSTFATPSSPANPLYNIAKHVQKPPDPPVCCLQPIPSNEPTEEFLLSFEEWKAKQEQSLKNGVNDVVRGNSEKSKGARHSDAPPESQPDAEDAEIHHPDPPLPPAHFRVPLTDRFNYASLDCSARVHYSHRSARSPASLLSSKKDKYMLSPCNTPGEDKFIVVELCEDIRIDTVQLANFEFFSGVFKDFSVSVAPTSPTDPEGWIPAGTYRAKNIRGIQVS